jgi:hypothetical protein
MGMTLDCARSRGHRELADLVAGRARDFHQADQGWNLAFEPGGQDFLSPGLSAADLMRRVLDPYAFAAWLARFLPQLGDDTITHQLQPAVVTDPTDGKLAHLDGLNLSRAWMLDGVLHGLPGDDPRRPRLERLAQDHRHAGLAALAGDHYMSTHWLGTFAIYMITGRGLARDTIEMGW